MTLLITSIACFGEWIEFQNCNRWISIWLFVSKIKCYKRNNGRINVEKLIDATTHTICSNHNAKCCDSCNFDDKNAYAHTWTEEKVAMRHHDIEYVDVYNMKCHTRPLSKSRHAEITHL